MLPQYVKEHIKAALAEDIGFGDITTDAIAINTVSKTGYIRAKKTGIVCGLILLKDIFHEVDKTLVVNTLLADGTKVSPGETLAEITGNPASILKGERVALNYLQYLSGIATKTAHIADMVKNTKVRIVDTRKTIPGMRWLSKYAVRIGGGHNHRFNLSDGVLIKDNHIIAAGGIKNALERAKAYVPHTVKIEIEVESIKDMLEAIAHGADIVMLDNMTPGEIKEAVKIADGRILLEASGGITEENILDYAKTGVDIISLGALTHTVRALDISLDLE